MPTRSAPRLRGALLCAAIAQCLPAFAQAPAEPRAIRAGAWTIVAEDAGMSAAVGDMSAFGGKPGMEVAQEAQSRAVRAGVASISATVDEQTMRIELRAAPIRVDKSGRYARFFESLDGRPLEQRAFEAAVRNAQSAARFNNDRLDIGVGGVVDGAMPFAVSEAATDDRRFGGAINLSTYGQRYSGRDLATLSAYANIGWDSQLTATESVGLPRLRSDSKGGFYRSSTIELSQATEWGVSTLRANSTSYKSGGALLPYDMRGDSTRLDAELSHPLDASSDLLAGVGSSRSTTELRAARLADTQAFRYGMAGYRRQDESSSFGARVYHGLGGSETFNASPLAGAFSPTFTALQIDGRHGFDLGSGWGLDVFGAAQVGSKATPGPMQFYAGGIDRGRAFNTGNIAGPSGIAGSTSLSKSVGAGLLAYAGVDAAKIKQTLGGSVAEASAFVGLRGALGDTGATLDFALAKALKAPKGESRKVGAMLMLSVPF